MRFISRVINRIREEKEIILVLLAIGMLGVYVVIQSSFTPTQLHTAQNRVVLSAKSTLSSESAKLQKQTANNAGSEKQSTSQVNTSNQVTNLGISHTPTPSQAILSHSQTPPS